ncbi:MAG: hypothetical protein WCY09_09215, partial [Candidatus Omnitrophota bacterium]
MRRFVNEALIQLRSLSEHVTTWMAEEPDPREDDHDHPLTSRQWVLVHAGYVTGALHAGLAASDVTEPSSELSDGIDAAWQEIPSHGKESESLAEAIREEVKAKDAATARVRDLEGQLEAAEAKAANATRDADCARENQSRSLTYLAETDKRASDAEARHEAALARCARVEQHHAEFVAYIASSANGSGGCCSNVSADESRATDAVWKLVGRLDSARKRASEAERERDEVASLRAKLADAERRSEVGDREVLDDALAMAMPSINVELVNDYGQGGVRISTMVRALADAYLAAGHNNDSLRTKLGEAEKRSLGAALDLHVARQQLDRLASAERVVESAREWCAGQRECWYREGSGPYKLILAVAALDALTPAATEQG